MSDPQNGASETGLSRIFKFINSTIVTVTAFIAAITALLLAWDGHLKIGQVEKLALETATQEARPTDNRPPVPSNGPVDIFVVQLASYLTANCSAAQEEIDQYRGKFTPEPTLWRAASQAYVVVGIAASNHDEASRQQLKAIAIAPNYPGNDLKNAKVRTNPGWRKITNCAAS